METKETLKDLCRRWDMAMETNDVDAIAGFMADDWICIGEKGPGKKADFLSWISSGDLLHTRMDSDEMIIRIYEDTAVVISRGTSEGYFKGTGFRLYEWSTNVFIKKNGKWLCDVTMLTPAAK